VLGEDSVQHKRMATLSWQSFLTPEQMATLIAPAHALSVFDLYAYIHEMEGSASTRAATRPCYGNSWRCRPRCSR
jgi:hypothetical protein